jgi:hypothetical protein
MPILYRSLYRRHLALLVSELPFSKLGRMLLDLERKDQCLSLLGIQSLHSTGLGHTSTYI